jgi:transposase
MRQLRQMLRLHHDGVSAREIGRRLGLARSTIQDNLKRAAAMGLGWPLPAELTDDELERRLFMRPGIEPGQRRRSEPDRAVLARELKRPGVNLMVLWENTGTSTGMAMATVASAIGMAMATVASAICSVNSSAGCRQ